MAEPYRYDLPDGPLRHLEVEADATPEDWTPGDRIVWSLPDAGIGEGVRSFELFTTASDGTDPRIFELEVSRTETHALHFRRQFQDRVAFAATSAGVGREIYTIGVDGTAWPWRSSTALPGSGSRMQTGARPTTYFAVTSPLGISWSRDGRWLFVQSPLSGEISRLDPATGEVTALTTGHEPGFLLRSRRADPVGSWRAASA